MQRLTLVRRAEPDPAVDTGGVILLEDIAGDPSTPPAGVAVFELDRAAGTARLQEMQLSPGYAQEQLIAGATMLLRADGFETIQT
jgi:hypothetical protein